MSSSGGLTLTLASNAVAYNLLALIQAVAGYANQHPTVRELTLTGDAGNGGASIYKGGSDVSSTNYGEALLATRSITYRSTLNDISLGDIWLVGSADGVKVNVGWMIY